MHAAISTKLDALTELCRRFHVRRLDIFGSAARGEDFDPVRSDADFLIEFEPAVKVDITTLLDVQGALEQTVGLPVDLVERIVVEQSRNYLRCRNILRDAEPIILRDEPFGDKRTLSIAR